MKTKEPENLTALERMYIQAQNNTAKAAHENSRNKGFWDDRDLLVKVAKKHSQELGKFAEIAVTGLCVALIHSELSEAMEAVRCGIKADDKIPDYSGFEAEMADADIREMDLQAWLKARVPEATVAKMRYNAGRERLHGKKA